MKIILVAGARPNFIKIAPLYEELKKHKNYFHTLLIHTGQHYDFQMSEVFFKDLNIPKPDICLNVGSASHAVQTAHIMIEFEKIVMKENPDLIIVVGDVNSTLACSLVAAKLHIKVAHVEAGLRSFDRLMPEEINRKLTDCLSDYLFVSEETGLENLKKEGIDSNKVYFVGNVMIDTLLANMDKIEKSDILNQISLKSNARLETLNPYAVLTLHRPSNVDTKESLTESYDILAFASQQLKIIYPIHPRTKKMIEMHNLLDKFEKLDNLIMVEPLGYIDFIQLVKNALFVLTDSGGIQEETTVLGVPCLTLRETTERPITISKGSNILVGTNFKKIKEEISKILHGNGKKGSCPELWDGKAAERIVNILKHEV